MNETELALVIITTVGALIGATGGLGGLAALRSSRSGALNATIATLQAENERLVKRMDDLEEELDALRIKFSETHHLATQLEGENKFLREQLDELREAQ